MPYIPGTGWKKVHVYVNDASHADLRIKLKYYDISQNEFLRTIIEAMIEDNPYMVKLIMEKLDSKKSLRKKNKIKKDTKEKLKTIKDFGLDENDIENIFDMIEKEKLNDE
jgi:hypothetical protein